jgi:hypothetical protein
VHVKTNLSDLLGLQSNPATQNASNLVTRKTSNASSSSATSNQSADDGLDDTDATTGATSPEQSFLDYMKEPVAQRMEEAWLKAHNLTEDDLKSMTPAQRDAIEKEMQADIKAKMQQQAQQKTQSNTPAQASSAASMATLLSSSI